MQLIARNKITMVGDSSQVRLNAVNNGVSKYVNHHGTATVTIKSNGATVTANVNAGQIYAYTDVGNGAVGFGSTAFGSGYPLMTGTDIVGNPAALWNYSCSANTTCSGATAGGIVAALQDALVNGNSGTYSAALLALPYDLRASTLLTDDAGSTCSNANLAACGIRTDHGALIINGALLNGRGIFSVSAGNGSGSAGSSND